MIPTFPRTVQDRISVPEDWPVQRVIYNFTALDDDQGYNGLLFYSIHEGNEDSKFNISATTGEFYLISALDREARSSYTFNIAVTDLGEPRKASNHIFTVDVTDVNDNAPQFAQASYDVSVSEASAEIEASKKASAISAAGVFHEHVRQMGGI